jgi:hypothetical protein
MGVIPPSSAFSIRGGKSLWLMPSLDIVKHANRGKTGKAAGKYRLVFTNTLVPGEVRPRPK